MCKDSEFCSNYGKTLFVCFPSIISAILFLCVYTRIYLYTHRHTGMTDCLCPLTGIAYFNQGARRHFQLNHNILLACLRSEFTIMQRGKG